MATGGLDALSWTGVGLVVSSIVAYTFFQQRFKQKVLEQQQAASESETRAAEFGRTRTHLTALDLLDLT